MTAGDHFESYVHDTAMVEKDAVLGANVKVWHWSHVCSQAVLGDNVNVGQSVFVGEKVRIGSGSRIQNNVSIFSGVEIAENVFCGPSVTFTNVKYPRAFRDQKDSFNKTVVNIGATLGANSSILCGITVGEYAFVAAGAVVTNDVLPFELVAGVPAKRIGWVSRAGIPLSFADSAKAQTSCPITGLIYVLSEGIVVESP